MIQAVDSLRLAEEPERRAEPPQNLLRPPRSQRRRRIHRFGIPAQLLAELPRLNAFPPTRTHGPCMAPISQPRNGTHRLPPLRELASSAGGFCGPVGHLSMA
jgi:hypothetical protein